MLYHVLAKYSVICHRGNGQALKKNTLYFVFSGLYLKNELIDPHFLFLKSNQKGKIKLCAKLKKILSGGLEPP